MANTIPGDPFPSIPPALLNSADIQAYQAACDLLKGEIINPASDRLKGATYKILFRGDVFWRDDEDGERKQQRIESSDKFIIPRNSIVFISPDTEFNLPDFIAARFNLTIPLVHQGLLLGTGPLVDPGFKGRLLIPLHNLTTRDVVVSGESGLIWVEFTKISTNFVTNFQTQNFEFVSSYRNRAQQRTVEDYFSGTGGVPVRSTLHDNAKKWESALSAVQTVHRRGESLRDFLQKLGWAGAIVMFLTVGSLIYAMYQTYGTFIGLVQQSQTISAELSQELSALKKERESTTTALQSRVAELEAIHRGASAQAKQVVGNARSNPPPKSGTQ